MFNRIKSIGGKAQHKDKIVQLWRCQCAEKQHYLYWLEHAGAYVLETHCSRCKHGWITTVTRSRIQDVLYSLYTTVCKFGLNGIRTKWSCKQPHHVYPRGTEVDVQSYAYGFGVLIVSPPLAQPERYEMPQQPQRNCSCSDKYEEWEYDPLMDQRYYWRECERCEYYWEGYQS